MYWVDVQDADKYLTVHGTAPAPDYKVHHPVQNVNRGWEVRLTQLQMMHPWGWCLTGLNREALHSFHVFQKRLIQGYG